MYVSVFTKDTECIFNNGFLHGSSLFMCVHVGMCEMCEMRDLDQLLKCEEKMTKSRNWHFLMTFRKCFKYSFQWCIAFTGVMTRSQVTWAWSGHLKLSCAMP